MATMESPAGEMGLEIRQIGLRDDRVVVKGTLGVWDATILFERSEIRRLIRIAPKRRLVAFMLRRRLPTARSHPRAAG